MENLATKRSPFPQTTMVCADRKAIIKIFGLLICPFHMENSNWEVVHFLILNQDYTLHNYSHYSLILLEIKLKTGMKTGIIITYEYINLIPEFI